jgi:hypothetical protein
MTKESQFGIDDTEENKRKALEALESHGSMHDAATAADVPLKTLMDWRRYHDQFACANLGVLRSQHCCTSSQDYGARACFSRAAGCALKVGGATVPRAQPARGHALGEPPSAPD